MRDWWKMWQSTLLLLWHQRRRMIARAHKDKRQRAAALLTLGIVLYVVFYSVYLVRNPAAAVMILFGVVVAAWIRRSHQNEDETFPTLTPGPALATPAETQSAYCVEEGRRVLFLWTLYVRALSELALKQETVLQSKVATRSVLLSRLRQLHIEEQLPSQQRDLHYLPDGSWTEDQTVAIVARGPELEVLLWAAGKHKSLTAAEDLNRVITLRVPDLEELCAPDALQWRDRNDMRTESYAAHTAWLRTFAEMRRRGLQGFALEDEELIAASESVATNVGDESRDMVLGTELITVCTDRELRIAYEQLIMRTAALRSLLAENESVEA